MLTERLARALVNFFYWHPVVQEYFMDGIYFHPSKLDNERSVIENWKIGLEYIREHGNSVWAKIDYFAGKLRIIIFILLVIVMFALIAGWRPYSG